MVGLELGDRGERQMRLLNAVNEVSGIGEAEGDVGERRRSSVMEMRSLSELEIHLLQVCQRDDGEGTEGV